MIRSTIIAIVMLFSSGTHAQAGWTGVVQSFFENIESLPGAIDELIRVIFVTPFDVVSCQIQQKNLKDVQEELIKVVASKSKLQATILNYSQAPNQDKFSRIGKSTLDIVESLRSFTNMCESKARAFTKGDLPNTFDQLSRAINSKELVLLDLRRLAEPKTASELGDMVKSAQIIDDEVNRLRLARDKIGEILAKGCGSE